MTERRVSAKDNPRLTNANISPPRGMTIDEWKKEYKKITGEELK